LPRQEKGLSEKFAEQFMDRINREKEKDLTAEPIAEENPPSQEKTVPEPERDEPPLSIINSQLSIHGAERRAGRPSSSDEPLVHKGYYLTPTLVRQIAMESASRGWDKSQLVREALIHYFRLLNEGN